MHRINCHQNTDFDNEVRIDMHEHLETCSMLCHTHVDKLLRIQMPKSKIHPHACLSAHIHMHAYI